MITSKQTFHDIEAMLQSNGWKLFQEDMERKAQAFLSGAIRGDSDRVIALEIVKYKVIKETIQGVYADYKTNYEKYKGVVNE